MKIQPLTNLTVCGDPHAENGNLEKIKTLFDIFEDLGNPVLLLGDLLDTKEIIRGKTLNYVRRRIKESKLFFFILVGNHDWFNLDCVEHSLESLKDLPNVKVIDQPYLRGKLLFMPYYDDLAKFKKALQNPEFKDAEVLFMHQGVIGFDYGNGHVADGLGHGEIEHGFVGRFKKVYSGHFHKFDQTGNLMFLGTPFTQDHGETNQVKYLGIFHEETQEMELFETSFPRHVTFDLYCDEADAMDSLRRQVKANEGNYVRVRLVGTEMQIAAIDQNAFPGVKFLDEPTDSEQVENENIKDTDSNEQKFMVWAKEIKGLDDQTISEGLEILKAS